MELYDVPFDLQELNVIVKSKHRPDEINFLSNFGEYLPVSQQLKRTFVDQQKWYFLFYLFVFCLLAFAKPLYVYVKLVPNFIMSELNFSSKKNISF